MICPAAFIFLAKLSAFSNEKKKEKRTLFYDY